MKKSNKKQNSLLVSIKNEWDSIGGITKKVVATILVIFAFSQGLMQVSSYVDHYATVKDVQAWDKNLEVIVVAQLQQFKSQNQQDWLQRRYTELTDQIFKIKLMMKQYPLDKDLIEDYKTLIEQRKDIARQIEESSNRLKQMQ